jgi:cell division topological specificity factor minE
MLEVLREFWNRNKRLNGNDDQQEEKEKTRNLAKERLNILLVQDRASISTDFMEIMKEDIVKVMQKYVIVDEKTVEIEMTNSIKNDGLRSETGFVIKAPIINVKNEMKAGNIQKTEEIVEELAEKKVEAIGDVEKEIEEQEKREILERNKEERRNKLLKEKEEKERLEKERQEKEAILQKIEEEKNETKEESDNQGE